MLRKILTSIAVPYLLKKGESWVSPDIDNDRKIALLTSILPERLQVLLVSWENPRHIKRPMKWSS
jgi:hypothetical protein